MLFLPAFSALLRGPIAALKGRTWHQMYVEGKGPDWKEKKRHNGLYFGATRPPRATPSQAITPCSSSSALLTTLYFLIPSAAVFRTGVLLTHLKKKKSEHLQMRVFWTVVIKSTITRTLKENKTIIHSNFSTRSNFTTLSGFVDVLSGKAVVSSVVCMKYKDTLPRNSGLKRLKVGTLTHEPHR